MLSFFPRDVLDEILDLIESVSVCFRHAIVGRKKTNILYRQNINDFTNFIENIKL